MDLYDLEALVRSRLGIPCNQTNHVPREESPVGKWTLKVSDQNNENKGHFLGWSMTFWGSAVDPDQAEPYELPDDPKEGHNLPPHPTSSEDGTKKILEHARNSG